MRVRQRDNEFHETNMPEGTKSFFDLDQSGVEFVFNLNFLGTLLPTQVLLKTWLGVKVQTSSTSQV